MVFTVTACSPNELTKSATSARSLESLKIESKFLEIATSGINKWSS